MMNYTKDRRVRMRRKSGKVHAAQRMRDEACATLLKRGLDDSEATMRRAMGGLRVGTKLKSRRKGGKKVQIPSPEGASRQWGMARKLLRDMVVKEAHKQHTPVGPLLGKELASLMLGQPCASRSSASATSKTHAKSLAARSLSTTQEETKKVEASKPKVSARYAAQLEKAGGVNEGFHIPQKRVKRHTGGKSKGLLPEESGEMD